MANTTSPVLILGAGINGCALARELLLAGVPVTLVDSADIASGATAYSSRLIHGGLRYLEYGEFDLVRESLAERTRLLELAPHLVKPLRLTIPVARRFGGLTQAALRFIGWRFWPARAVGHDRGLATIRMGLRLYDTYAADPQLPHHRTVSVANSPLPVDRSRYRWLCQYYDAQVMYPERLTLALLRDAQRVSQASGVPLEVFTHHESHRSGGEVELRPSGVLGSEGTTHRLRPAAIVNATGAWVDSSLRRLEVSSPRLIGGTKGSHLITFHPALRAALAEGGIYAEARDGRPVFILPLGEAALIGTTDIPWEQPPEDARASANEIDYLLAAVNEVLPEVRFTRGDADFFYCGVRPLPYIKASATAGITRRHQIHEHADAPLPMISLIGGKLTTCRSFAAEAAARLLARLDRTVPKSSASRPLPGGENYPASHEALAAEQERLASQYGLPVASVRAIWDLHGTDTDGILRDIAGDSTLLAGTPLPRAFVLWTLRSEWVGTLSDLIERRLMLLYHHEFGLSTITALAELFAAERGLPASEVPRLIAQVISGLHDRYGKQIT